MEGNYGLELGLIYQTAELCIMLGAFMLLAVLPFSASLDIFPPLDKFCANQNPHKLLNRLGARNSCNVL